MTLLPSGFRLLEGESVKEAPHLLPSGSSAVRWRRVLLSECWALCDPAVLARVMEAFWGAILGRGWSLTYGSPGVGVGTGQGVPSSPARGVSAKMAFQGRRPIN